ncbi:hypothetical protein NO135_23140, partial [Clostridioides difficile]|nr:hypothetical protein [Clostridioides difficile]
GYSAFDSVRLFKGGQAMSTPRIYKGKENTVQVGVKGDQWATVPRGLGDKIKTEVDVNAPLIAPLAAYRWDACFCATEPQAGT